MPLFDQTPDAPKLFGFKISWFVVRSADPASILEALEFGEGTPANWASGIAASHGDAPSGGSWVFVSPPVGGWIFVVGASLPYPTVETHHHIGKRFDELFSRLMKRFDDVQFFGSHRVVDFVTWARAVNGTPTRIFGFADSAVLANVGCQTPAEAKLGFLDLGGLSPSDATDNMFRTAEEQDEQRDALIATGLSRPEARAKVLEKGRHGLPDETYVIDLAALWSINPLRLSEQDQPPSVGIAARLPENLAQ
jgi:hypothetical protein